jgi:hypothetical protein
MTDETDHVIEHDIEPADKFEKVSGATKKMDSWAPQGIPMAEDERQAYEDLAVQAVYSWWAFKHEPSSLQTVARLVFRRISAMRDEGTWPWKTYRSKRSLDRRVNEAASRMPKPKIVAVTAGIYQPNPELSEFFDNPREVMQ